MTPSVSQATASGSKDQVDANNQESIVLSEGELISDDDDVVLIEAISTTITTNGDIDYRTLFANKDTLVPSDSPKKANEFKWKPTSGKRVTKFAKKTSTRLSWSASAKKISTRIAHRKYDFRYLKSTQVISSYKQLHHQRIESSDEDAKRATTTNNGSQQDDASLAKELLTYQFQPWTELTELILVHSGIYSSIRFECVEQSNGYGKRAFLDSSSVQVDSKQQHQHQSAVDNTNGASSKLSYSRDKLTQWKDFLRSTECKMNDIIFAHLTALESILNALLETHCFEQRYPNGCGNSSLLYSLYCKFTFTNVLGYLFCMHP